MSSHDPKKSREAAPPFGRLFQWLITSLLNTCALQLIWICLVSASSQWRFVFMLFFPALKSSASLFSLWWNYLYAELYSPFSFPFFSLRVHETNRTISVSCSKAFSLLFNSVLWLFPALSLTTFWILKCEPQAWMCYLILFSLCALYGGKLTSPSLLSLFHACSFPGSSWPLNPAYSGVMVFVRW